MNRFLLLILFLGLPGLVAAQQGVEARLQALEGRVSQMDDGLPQRDYHLSGYMSSQFVVPEGGPSTFATAFSPIFLYRAGDKFLFEAELEFGFDGTETAVTLEYAQLDYMFSDAAVLVMGKFLLPMGTFGERTHPSWINKLPTAPPIYGGHHGSGLGIIPIMMDFGVQLRGGLATGGVRWNYSLYATNGPQAVSTGEIEEGAAAGHGHLTTRGVEDNPEFRTAVGHDEGSSGVVGAVAWDPSVSDDNNNKGVGFRVGFIPGNYLEVGLSRYTAAVTYQPFHAADEAPGAKTDGDITLTMLDFVIFGDKFRLEGEYLQEDASGIGEYATSSSVDEMGMIDTEHLSPPKERTGYWLQASYNFGGWMPETVLRFGTVSTDGNEIGSETALGLNWWLESSVILKVAGVSTTIEGAVPDDTTTDYYIQIAFGF